jgi:signal peptidase II
MATFHVDRWESPSPLGSRLLIIGALGNLLDRMIHGFVIDFISIGRFPVFNIADICITVGIGLLIYRSLRQA